MSRHELFLQLVYGAIGCVIGIGIPAVIWQTIVTIVRRKRNLEFLARLAVDQCQRYPAMRSRWAEDLKRTKEGRQILAKADGKDRP